MSQHQAEAAVVETEKKCLYKIGNIMMKELKLM